MARCFVLVDEAGKVAGCYTLSATSIAMDQLSPERTKKLPRYPAVLLGRLAVSKDFQGQRLGSALVADAMLRAARAEVMCHVMVVDAKDEAAARFHEHLEFERLRSDPLKLVPML